MKDLSDVILVAAGVVISLAFSYFPALKDWFEKQSSGNKALLQLGVSLAVAGIYFGLACTALAGKLNIAVTCDGDGALAVALAFIKIVLANQATYLLTPSKK